MRERPRDPVLARGWPYELTTRCTVCYAHIAGRVTQWSTLVPLVLAIASRVHVVNTCDSLYCRDRAVRGSVL